MSSYRTGETVTIPNKAEITINDQTSVSNEVTTSYHEPGLEIEKSVDHEEREVGQEAVYTVKVRQTKKDAVATNVTIRDCSLPEELPIRPESVRADGVEILNIRRTGNGWILATPRLSYGEEIRILYTAGIEKGASGKEVVNTATAKSDELEPIQAQARVKIKNVPEQKALTKTLPGKDKGNTMKKSKEPNVKSDAQKTASSGHAVKTGDEMPVMSLIVIMAVALMAGVMTWLRAKK